MIVWKLVTVSIVTLATAVATTVSLPAQSGTSPTTRKYESRRLKQQRELEKALRRSRARKFQKDERANQGRFVSIEEIRAALTDTYQAALDLREAASQLVELSESYAGDEVSPQVFRKSARNRLSSMRKLSRQIHQNRILEIIAGGTELAVEKPPRQLDREGFSDWSKGLLAMADLLRKRIAFFYQDRDFTKVQFDQLNLPSTKSLSKGIETISKSLGQSVKRL